jgi:hypothetical protein
MGKVLALPSRIDFGHLDMRHDEIPLAVGAAGLCLRQPLGAATSRSELNVRTEMKPQQFAGDDKRRNNGDFADNPSLFTCLKNLRLFDCLKILRR